MIGAPAREDEPKSGAAEDADDSGGNGDRPPSDSPCPACKVGRMGGVTDYE